MLSVAVSTASSPLINGQELAAAAPVTRAERISSIDVLRGVALLGIHLLNIEDFAGPSFLHDVPVPYQFYAAHTQIKTCIFFLKWMFFEGKMRGIFSMLFGAGAILMTRRADDAGRGNQVADVFTRRNMWLMLFGFLHFVLLWHGDILFSYGFVALLFLYPMRRLGGKTLVWIASLLMLVLGPLTLLLYLGMPTVVPSYQRAQAAIRRQSEAKPLTLADESALNTWREIEAGFSVTPQSAAARIVTRKSEPYGKQVLERATIFYTQFPNVELFVIPDVLSAMLLGMGLMKLGFFNGEWSNAAYLRTTLIGFSIALPVEAFGVHKVIESHFSIVESDKWLYLPYYVGREPGSVAIAALVILACKTGWAQWLQRRLAAVGRTALSNYLLTSFLCQMLFSFGPLRLYGKLQYDQQLYVVASIWTVNIVLSTLWLRHFAYGPIEWLWRSLTYGKRQNMRISSSNAA